MLFYILGLILVTTAYAGDPEANMKTPEIIAHWGYPLDEIQATTDDGYILTMYRIPHGKNQDPSGKRPVLFLQHGLLASSSNWVTPLPNLGLGFMAADAGFDVWLGNVRGCEYSVDHKTLNHTDPAYWRFSWDEMAKYDIPAMVNKALEVSGQDQLYYVGHSQGTLIMFSHLSTDTDLNSKIRQFHALAPIGTVKYIQGLLEFIAKNFENDLEVFHDLFGDGAFLPPSPLVTLFEKLFCSTPAEEQGLCENFLVLICGPESNQMNTTRLPVFLTDMPGGTSTQNILHWCQMVNSGLQNMYDYGSPQNNTLHYGQPTPPVYDISKITVPMYLYWSDADWLGDTKDIESHLLPNLPKKFLIENNHLVDFNHLDFIWGQRAAPEIFTPMIEKMLTDWKGH